MKLLNLLRRRPRADDFLAYHVLSFAQEGEDRLLLRLLEGTPAGFYVDVGAHHPQRFSNTHAFYLRGWRGINIDAAPGTKDLFDRLRPRDINLELAIGPGDQRSYIRFAEPALNGFDDRISQQRSNAGHSILGRMEMTTVPLAEVLDRYLPPKTALDFLSVDVEGLDLEVLRSNDWEKYRPRFVLAEEHGLRNLLKLDESPLVKFMQTQGYVPVAKTLNTVFFERQ